MKAVDKLVREPNELVQTTTQQIIGLWKENKEFGSHSNFFSILSYSMMHVQFKYF